MMPATYEPIATATISSPTVGITFSSIPSTYTDLRIVFNGKYTTSAAYLGIRFNSDTGTNYSDTLVGGDGTSAFSLRSTNVTTPNLAYVYSANPATAVIDVFNYAGATHKTVLSSGFSDINSSGSINLSVALWRNTSAINTIRIADTSFVRNFDTGTIATLFGIKAA